LLLANVGYWRPLAISTIKWWHLDLWPIILDTCSEIEMIQNRTEIDTNAAK